jgi:integrase
MGEAALVRYEAFDDKYNQMTEYLSTEGGYWIENDRWYLKKEIFNMAGIDIPDESGRMLADFSGYHKEKLKNEMKYFLLHAMKEKELSALSIYGNCKSAIVLIGEMFSQDNEFKSFAEINADDRELENRMLKSSQKERYLQLKHGVTRCITDYYDERDELEKDVWHVAKIPGVRISAAAKWTDPSMNFQEIPLYYREMVKRFMGRLIIKRSWSHCTEMLMYIRYFFKTYYKNSYTDGFFETLTRKDVEKYLNWVAADYANRNATVRSKAVSFVRQYIDYIQLAEYQQAPEKDVNRLIFDDDIPKRERSSDTMSKMKYIPEPVREQLDSSINEIEPEEMMPVYVLLRESGWRGTDVLNLRYNSCLDYLWNNHEQKYIPYLCGEITKTGIPLLRIPIREEVAEMVKKLSDEAAAESTEENNPDKYLFNTYGGRNKGLPYSKPAFSLAVQELINQKGIRDWEGKIYHFKAHSLRHTRAMEYTEQGMPIGIIQQILGHCSLQMTLHYAKVSEDMLYKKWKETEKLNLLHLESVPPDKRYENQEDVHYEFIRKNLDAVRVPFGVCFKPSKLPCRQQMNHCIDCANFCTGKENINEYEEEIRRVKKQLVISREQGRAEWEEKSLKYLEVLEKMLERIQKEGTIHKNGKLREDCNG